MKTKTCGAAGQPLHKFLTRGEPLEARSGGTFAGRFQFLAQFADRSDRARHFGFAQKVKLLLRKLDFEFRILPKGDTVQPASESQEDCG